MRKETPYSEGTFACMKAAYDAGINMFDCAENYSGGEAERAMGAAIRKFGWKRSDLVISTKVSKPTVTSPLGLYHRPVTWRCSD